MGFPKQPPWKPGCGRERGSDSLMWRNRQVWTPREAFAGLRVSIGQVGSTMSGVATGVTHDNGQLKGVKRLIVRDGEQLLSVVLSRT
jgi:hypothetical protein